MAKVQRAGSAGKNRRKSSTNAAPNKSRQRKDVFTPRSSLQDSALVDMSYSTEKTMGKVTIMNDKKLAKSKSEAIKTVSRSWLERPRVINLLNKLLPVNS